MLGYFMETIASALPWASNGGSPLIAEGKEPQVFDGKAVNVAPFLQEIRATVHFQHGALITDYDRTCFFSGYLRSGAPNEWWNMTIKHEPGLQCDWETLLDHFEQHFHKSTTLLLAQWVYSVMKHGAMYNEPPNA